MIWSVPLPVPPGPSTLPSVNSGSLHGALLPSLPPAVAQVISPALVLAFCKNVRMKCSWLLLCPGHGLQGDLLGPCMQGAGD
jgi:hypothetical protein